LRGGTVIFTPVTNDVVLRLEVDRPDSPTTISESVRIAGGLPSPLPAQTSSSGNHKNSTLVEASEAHSSADSAIVSEHASTLKAETDDLPVTETVNVQQPSQAAIPKSSVEPVLTASANSSLNAVPKFSPHSTSPLPPEPNEAPQLDSISTPLAISASAIRELVLPRTHPETVEDTRMEPAQLIAKTDPVYPPVARQSGVMGTVEVHFRIGVDGTVHDVKVIKGNPLLANAAARALQTWRYNPARLNGIRVESDGSAIVDFK
jgi:TonB family protein